MRPRYLAIYGSNSSLRCARTLSNVPKLIGTHQPAVSHDMTTARLRPYDYLDQSSPSLSNGVGLGAFAKAESVNNLGNTRHSKAS
jgi:hypothetical protein